MSFFKMLQTLFQKKLFSKDCREYPSFYIFPKKYQKPGIKVFCKYIMPYKIPYKITKYTYSKAKKLGVTIAPSTNKTKKLDVYKNNNKIGSIGAYGMNDFPTYKNLYGIKYAKTRRRLYKIRHNKDRHIKWSNGWLADKLLWS